MTLRTFIYARYSSDLQDVRSIEDQIAACRSYAERQSWDVADVFTDYAISGAAGIEQSQRPGLNAMLAAVRERKAEIVLADSTSRIARNQGDGHRIREDINFGGARLFTVADGEIDAFKGAIKGLLDEQQRQELAHNIKRGQRGVVKEGRAPAGLAYGYKRANRFDDRGELVRGLREIDPDQAAVVLRIFREYADGHSPQSIAARLNGEAIPSPQGGTWRMTTILGDRVRQNGMLNNRLYAGVLVHNRTSKVVDPRTRRTIIRPNPESEWITQAVEDLRIVPQELWDRVQERRGEFDGGARKHLARRPKHLLSGLGQCGICGGAWTRIGAEYWGCGRAKDGGGCANTRTIKNDKYEAEVLRHVQSELLAPDLVAAYVREYHREYARRSADLAKARDVGARKLAEQERRIERLVSAIAAGGNEFAEVREALGKAKAERDRIGRDLANAEALPVLALHPGIADEYRRQIAALSEALAENEATRLEAIPKLRALIDRVEVFPAEGKRGAAVKVIGRMAEIIDLATAPTKVAKVQ